MVMVVMMVIRTLHQRLAKHVKAFDRNATKIMGSSSNSGESRRVISRSWQVYSFIWEHETVCQAQQGFTVTCSVCGG